MRRVSRGWRGMIRWGVIGSGKACLADFGTAGRWYSVSLNGSTAFADDRFDVWLLYYRT